MKLKGKMMQRRWPPKVDLSLCNWGRPLYCAKLFGAKLHCAKIPFILQLYTVKNKTFPCAAGANHYTVQNFLVQNYTVQEILGNLENARLC